MSTPNNGLQMNAGFTTRTDNSTLLSSKEEDLHYANIAVEDTATGMRNNVRVATLTVAEKIYERQPMKDALISFDFFDGHVWTGTFEQLYHLLKKG